MNIFVLDRNPASAAQMYCDKHVPKMVVELFQILGSAQRRHGTPDEAMPLTANKTPLKGGYHNHPCTRWAGDTFYNYGWAAAHAVALCMEYSLRFSKIHACQEGIMQLRTMAGNIPNWFETPFAQAMPDKYKKPCAIEAYRDFYWNEKRKFAKWEKGREVPVWWYDLEEKEFDDLMQNLSKG